MQPAPTTWPTGSRHAGSPLLTCEKEAWQMGFRAGSDDAARQIREAIRPAESHSEVEIPEEQ